MKLSSLIAAVVLSLREGVVVSGFSITSSHRPTSSRTKLLAVGTPNSNESSDKHMMHRRNFLSNFLLTASSTLPFFLQPTTTNAATIPSVTSAEFDVILKDSAKSILYVELSGPKSETALVQLADGTTFSVSDLVESSTDPRSPLKLVARCRLYKIPVKNTGLTSALSGEGSIVSSSGKKKKNYMNPRVQEAQKKELARKERMAEDERERLEELYKMEEKEEGFLKE